MTMIKEKGGRPTCTLCGYEWSGMLGDDEWPDKCACAGRSLLGCAVWKGLLKDIISSSDANCGDSLANAICAAKDVLDESEAAL